METVRSSGRIALVLPLLLLLACGMCAVAAAQSLSRPLDAGAPANDCGCPQGDNPVAVSSGMFSPYLPKIPNLELGWQYSFGKNVSTGRFTADYLLPFRLGPDSVLFGEAHAEGWDFRKRPDVSGAAPVNFTTTTSSTNNRIDLSFGGGYRSMRGANTLLGVNGFYDTSRLFGKWYSSGGIGLETAATVGGDDAVDLNFNWYGNLFNKDTLVNAFRNKGNSFDLEAGYSHALFNQTLDLRLKVAGYQFDVGTPVHGWRSGADLTTRNGVFTLRYEHGSDRFSGDYNTVGGFVNVGFRLENLLSGESPFTTPEPVFKSPRDLRRLLGLKVKRNWHHPESVVAARSAAYTTACANLQGNVAYPYTVMLHYPSGPPQVYPTIPAFQVVNPDPASVRLCWCNVVGAPVITFFSVYASATTAYGFFPTSGSLTLTPESSCAVMPFTGKGTPTFPALAPGFIFGGQDIVFGDSGGGLSVQMQ